VESILRQRIGQSVKEHMISRFDRNGDGAVSINEFLDRIMPSSVTTLYSFLPGNI
jgi:Ca2+-binding EF-hand superfamily protein